MGRRTERCDLFFQLSHFGAEDKPAMSQDANGGGIELRFQVLVLS